ncbi:MAG: 50S ribosomal protein L4 [Dissulfurispiraceae bacterium]|jgi:large subunit ribosomal protein L4
MQPENITMEIKDINNNVKGTMDLNASVFGNEACDSVVHSSVVSFLANQRQGTHATKTRGLVSGGGKKPWKQKHTGRARQGSIRAPQWRGGGIVFGPQPRDYSTKLPKQMRKVALFKALTMKMADGQVVLLDALAIEKPRTKEMLRVLGNLGLSDKTVLIVLAESDRNIVCSARNIPGVDVIRASDLNAYAVAVYDHVVFTADALAKLQG